MKRRAARLEKPVEVVLEELIATLPQEEELHEFDLAAYLSLPKEERSRLLRAQAEMAAAEYKADLDLPVEARELTAFTALDGEPFGEHSQRATYD